MTDKGVAGVLRFAFLSSLRNSEGPKTEMPVHHKFVYSARPILADPLNRDGEVKSAICDRNEHSSILATESRLKPAFFSRNSLAQTGFDRRYGSGVCDIECKTLI